MNELIWYSWLGGIIIGTMIGANIVLDEHCRAGPRNVVITGRYMLSLSMASPVVAGIIDVQNCIQ